MTAAPSPVAVAEASRRLHRSAGPLAPVHQLPRSLELRPTTRRSTCPAVERDRIRWAECSRGAHVWTATPTAVVCLHCPTRQDQAARVCAAHQARQVGQ